jgi:hypothetical protein
LARAIGDQTARVYAFGQRWGPEDGKPDKILGFQPGNGVHDIHMNQGSSGQLGGDNGVWQDGGLILHIAREDRRVGIFLAFQGQAWHTDDTTGDAIGHAPPPAAQEQAAAVRIIGALSSIPSARRRRQRASCSSTRRPMRSTSAAGASPTRRRRRAASPVGRSHQARRFKFPSPTASRSAPGGYALTSA